VFSGECLYMLEGHSHFINSVVFSHDSTRLASASLENIVKVWDANNGTCLQTFESHRDFVSSVVFSHYSTKLASASNDKTVKVWDANNGTCLQTFEGHRDFVSSVVFSHDLTKLASASNDKTVKVWDASSGACLQTLNIGKTLYSLFFDSNSSFLRTEIGLIAIHGLGTSSETAVVEPARPQYLGISLSSDGIWIMHDGKNVLWIPPEYRPSCSTVSGNTVSMGVGSGRVWTCSVHPDISVC
jgi:WD40 repeat protein